MGGLVMGVSVGLMPITGGFREISGILSIPGDILARRVDILARKVTILPKRACILAQGGAILSRSLHIGMNSCHPSLFRQGRGECPKVCVRAVFGYGVGFYFFLISMRHHGIQFLNLVTSCRHHGIQYWHLEAQCWRSAGGGNDFLNREMAPVRRRRRFSRGRRLFGSRNLQMDGRWGMRGAWNAGQSVGS